MAEIVEVLQSIHTPMLIARLSDGSYRWLSDDLRVVATGGPAAAWVERTRGEVAADGWPATRPVLRQDIAVALAQGHFTGGRWSRSGIASATPPATRR